MLHLFCCCNPYWKNNACNMSVTCKYQAATSRMFTAFYYCLIHACFLLHAGIWDCFHACNKHVAIHEHACEIHALYKHWPCHCTCIGHALLHWMHCIVQALAMHCYIGCIALYKHWLCTVYIGCIDMFRMCGP